MKESVSATRAIIASMANIALLVLFVILHHHYFCGDIYAQYWVLTLIALVAGINSFLFFNETKTIDGKVWSAVALIGTLALGAWLVVWFFPTAWHGAVHFFGVYWLTSLALRSNKKSARPDLPDTQTA